MDKQENKKSVLIELDGYGNIILGLPLLLVPNKVSNFFGLSMDQPLYPILLGAILIGIGIALLLECYSKKHQGLGIAGAICINLTVGIILGFWLILNHSVLSNHGYIVLWFLVVILIGIGSIELFALKNSKTS